MDCVCVSEVINYHHHNNTMFFYLKKKHAVICAWRTLAVMKNM